MGERLDARAGVYMANRAGLVDYASRLLGTRDGAEDIVQDAFLRFVPASSGHEAPPPKSYLFRIVHNLVVDRQRRRRLEAAHSGYDVPEWVVPVAASTPEEAVLFCEGMRLALDVIASLPERQRIALEMVRFGGFTAEDVAKHLGVSTRTAYRLVEDAMYAVTMSIHQNEDGSSGARK